MNPSPSAQSAVDLFLPPVELTTTPAPWVDPVQQDLFGQSLLDLLEVGSGFGGINPSTPNTAGFFLESLKAVRVAAVKAPAWCTLFVCYRDPDPADPETWPMWYSGVAGGISYGAAPSDRLFYFQGTPHIHAPSATLDAAVRHALAEARGMFSNYHGAQDGSTAAAAQALSELLRRA